MLDIATDKAIDANKRQNTIAIKKLNTAADKTVNTNKRQDIATELSMLIKDQIIRQTNLES